MSLYRSIAAYPASALTLLLILALLVVGSHALAHLLIGTSCPIVELLN